MAVPTITPFPYLAPLGAYPPASLFPVMCTADFTPVAGPDPGSYIIIPEQPGTYTGGENFTPATWQVTNIWWVCQVPSSSVPNTVTIERCIRGALAGSGPFTVSNAINSTPVTIYPGQNVQSIQPAVIDMPYVVTGDIIRANYGAIGTSAANFSLMLALVLVT